MIDKILQFLSGKKSMIASLVGSFTSYLAVAGLIGSNEVALIGSISLIVFGTASIATGQYFKKKR